MDVEGLQLTKTTESRLSYTTQKSNYFLTLYKGLLYLQSHFSKVADFFCHKMKQSTETQTFLPLQYDQLLLLSITTISTVAHLFGLFSDSAVGPAVYSMSAFSSLLCRLQLSGVLSCTHHQTRPRKINGVLVRRRGNHRTILNIY